MRLAGPINIESAALFMSTRNKGGRDCSTRYVSEGWGSCLYAIYFIRDRYRKGEKERKIHRERVVQNDLKGAERNAAQIANWHAHILAHKNTQSHALTHPRAIQRAHPSINVSVPSAHTHPYAIEHAQRLCRMWMCVRSYERISMSKTHLIILENRCCYLDANQIGDLRRMDSLRTCVTCYFKSKVRHLSSNEKQRWHDSLILR